jgi:glycosyltransferase involved in cell wall biosynthesis
MYSIIIPVFMNSSNIMPLLSALEGVLPQVPEPTEVVFVVDGSPDDSAQLLLDKLPAAGFRSQVVVLSRNFGSFNAIRVGLDVARGERYAAIAADLQEPPEVLLGFHGALASGDADVAFGRRLRRTDPAMRRALSGAYWWLYRRLVMPEIPEGGVDTFACTRRVRDVIVSLRESNTSLLGLLVWVGYRRVFVGYERRQREHGSSAWTLGKRIKYLMDSVFGFSDLPIRLLIAGGCIGILASLTLGVWILTAKLLGGIGIPGYAATMTVILFFGALNLLGLGVIGGYVWRTFENSKQRPYALIESRAEFDGRTHGQ